MTYLKNAALAVIAFLHARVTEGTSQAMLAAAMATGGAYAAGQLTGEQALVGIAIAAIGILVPESRPLLSLVSKTPAGPAVGALLVWVVAGSVLSACTPAEVAEAKVAASVACRVDAAAQPIVVTLAPALVPDLAPIAATDQALIHPAVVAACAAIGGAPVSVTATP